MKTIIYHNPRCSKSREALKLLQEHESVEVREYLKEVPDEKEIKQLIQLLGIKPIQLIRVKEEVFLPYKGKSLTDEECIELMAKHPLLIERPIVIKGDKAVIGRPPSFVLSLLKP